MAIRIETEDKVLKLDTQKAEEISYLMRDLCEFVNKPDGIITRKDMVAYEAHVLGAPRPGERKNYIRGLTWLANDSALRISRGVYDVSRLVVVEPKKPEMVNYVIKVEPKGSRSSVVPGFDWVAFNERPEQFKTVKKSKKAVKKTVKETETPKQQDAVAVKSDDNEVSILDIVNKLRNEVNEAMGRE